MHILRKTCLWALILCFGANFGWAAGLTVPQPGSRVFIADHAAMLNTADAEAITEMADQLLTDTATPILVVTIDSMGQYAGSGYSIERFARELFNQWGIGHAELNGEDWNTGMMLLVSKSDRKSRIELGAGWGHAKDAECREIMDTLIIPQFKQGDFSNGILLGVEGLEQIARGKELPSPPIDWKQVGIYAALIVFIGMTLYSIFNSGKDGWGWMFWVGLFGIIGTILIGILTSSGRSSGGGGGFSGGSFGGGFSGGGGASGSW